jgi:hypothetical protein
MMKNIVDFYEREWLSIRSLLGNTWAWFYILIGGRECGKSYAVMSYFLWEWKTKHKPFTWLRLTEASVRKMLQNDAMNMVDPDLHRKFGLELTVKGCQVYDHGEPMAKVLALSTFYSDKGVALYDNEYDLGYNICLDEMNRERSEKRTFDVNYAFVNQMENLVRSSHDKMRIFLIGNTLQEASDIMCSFEFIPETFGRYKVRSKHAVIEYIPESKKYLARRKNTIAGVLAKHESTFTNLIEINKDRVYSGRCKKPTMVIRFSPQEAYTVWDSNVIHRYNKEKGLMQVNMVAYLQGGFNARNRDLIMDAYHAEAYMFKNLFIQKTFKRALELVKPRG